MYGEDVYNSPGKYGLDSVGCVEWHDEPYSFNLTGTWRDPATGVLYWADDSGCSCPSPFEDYTDRESLTTGTPDELGAHLAGRLEGATSGSAAGAVADLMLRVKAYPPVIRGSLANEAAIEA